MAALTDRDIRRVDKPGDVNARTNDGVMQEHPVEVALFDRTGPITFLWLIIRLWLGFEWTQAGWEKLTNPAWMNGTVIGGFWKASVGSYGQPHSQVAYDWYAGFLQGLMNSHSQTWFGPLVAWAELIGGIALILGLFTGIVAFLLALMNFNYMLAGSAGVNPVYFILALALMMAWKNAGWWGLDRWVLPALGTPWRPGHIFHRHDAATGTTTTTTTEPAPAEVRVDDTRR